MRKGRSSYLFYENERIITKQENAFYKFQNGVGWEIIDNAGYLYYYFYIRC